MADNKNINEEAGHLSDEKQALLDEIKRTYSASAEDTGLEEATDIKEEEISKEPSPTEDVASEESSEVAETTLEDELEEAITSPAISTSKHTMPKYGKGFIFVPVISIITIIAVILGHIHPIDYGIPGNATYRYIYLGLGVVLCVIALLFIVNAVTESNIMLNAQMGKLVTTGVYSKTRHPMYLGVLLACTGALFISGNAFMYALPIVYWIFLSVLMDRTEEKLLIKNFGDEYKEYIESTNKISPLPKRS